MAMTLQCLVIFWLLSDVLSLEVDTQPEQNSHNLKNFFYSLLVKAKQIKSPTSFTVKFYQCIFCMQKDLKKPIIVNVCIIHVLVAVLDPYSVICFVFPRDI